MKLADIAERLGCRLEGDGAVEIIRVTGLQQAQPGDLAFFANARYLDQLATTRASAVIVGDAPVQSVPPGCAVLHSRNPYAAFARALGFFNHAEPPPKGVDRLSAIASDATLGPDVSIGPFVTIGSGATIGARTIIFPNVVVGRGARIGDDCVIHAQASIRDRVVIGNRVILQNGVVVGSDGFGFATERDGTHLKIPQEADVVIEDDVMMAGQTGVTGHIRIGRGTKIGAKSAVLQSVDPGGFVTGHPAIEHADWRKASVVFRQLPTLKKRVEELEQRIAELEEKLAKHT